MENRKKEGEVWRCRRKKKKKGENRGKEKWINK